MTVIETTVAELLKKTRIERGQTIKDIASETRIASAYLQAMEDAAYDALPERAFAVGFVKCYAMALGLDPAIVAEAFKTEAGYNTPFDASRKTSASLQTSQRKISPWLAPVLGLVGVSLCWIFFGPALISGQPGVEDINPAVAVDEAQLAAVTAMLLEAEYPNEVIDNLTYTAPHEGAQLKAPFVPTEAPSFVTPIAEPREQAPKAAATETSLVSVSDTQSEKNGPAQYGFLLQATEDSWLKLVREDGSEIWTGILKAGQTYQPAEKGVVFLYTSNAGGVLVQGSASGLSRLGKRGTVLSGFRLDKAAIVTTSVQRPLLAAGLR